MITETFITENPGATIVYVGILLILIKGLVAVLSKLITQPYNNLTKAIDTLTTAVMSIQTEMRESREIDRSERKAEREKDLKQVGLLRDRMQAQETICKTTRHFCPHRNVNASEPTD